MIDVLSLAEEDAQLHKAAINEMAGACPKCGGNDRFRVRYFRDTGVWKWMCRSCWDAGQYLPDKGRKRGWGDEIDYLRHYRGKSYQEAAMLVREDENTIPAQHPIPAQARYLSDDWQAQTLAAMQEHSARLWSADPLALNYAHDRGLYDHTIKQFQLGYSLAEGIPRLVIPNINDGRYTTIYRRDLRPDVPHAQRWKDARGGGKDELYLSDCLYHRVDVPVVLCEDAFSALSIYQECGDKVNVVATGGVKSCMTTKWVARLACMPLVLIALDADPEGDKQSQEWLKLLKNARRLRPLLKDPNDMLMDGWDLRAWVLQSIDVEPEELPALCSTCLDENRETVAPFEVDEIMYCKKHIPSSPAATVQEEKLSPADHPGFHAVVQLFEATIHFDPPGYTIADRARELEQEACDRIQARRRLGKVGVA